MDYWVYSLLIAVIFAAVFIGESATVEAHQKAKRMRDKPIKNENELKMAFDNLTNNKAAESIDPIGWFYVDLPYHQGESLGLRIVSDNINNVRFPIVKGFIESKKEMWMSKYKVKSGDYILDFNNRRIDSMQELQDQISSLNKINQLSFTLPIKFGRPLSKVKANDDVDLNYEYSPNKRELTLSDGQNRFFDIEMTSSQVKDRNGKNSIVTVVSCMNGIVKPGDILLSINDQKVHSIAHLNQLVRIIKMNPNSTANLKFLRKLSKYDQKANRVSEECQVPDVNVTISDSPMPQSRSCSKSCLDKFTAGLPQIKKSTLKPISK